MPEEVQPGDLDPQARRELTALSKGHAGAVARHLVMAGRLLDEDPELAYQHAQVARRLASRIGVVREAAGITAYATGKYAEALAELRAAHRITGAVDTWPIMADCERGLGRPQRALAMAGSPEVRQLDRAGRVEMRIVAAGARRDLGQIEAAVVTLQGPELSSGKHEEWLARLRYAYADALLAAGRAEEAREWFARAAEADTDEATDAADRLAELDGVVFLDADDADDADAPDRGDGENGQLSLLQLPERPATD